MLKQRVVTAVFLTVLFLSLLLLAPAGVFLIFVTAVIAVAAWEWANLCGIESQVMRVLYAGSLIAVGGFFWFAVFQAHWFELKSLLVVSGIWWAVALLWIQGYPSSAIIWQPSLVRMFMGGFVLLPALLGVYSLVLQEQGAYFVLGVVAIVAAADIGAYFSGKLFGKRKLAPRVSPGKSWEGVAGGLVLVSTVALIFSVLNDTFGPLHALLIAVPTAMVSVLGDLLESMVKRQRGVKDSSQLLPGHGGVLDRVDGLVAAIPVFALMLSLSYWR